MNHLLHLLLTLVLTLLAIVGMVGLAVWISLQMLTRETLWLLPVMGLIALALGMFVPQWLMTRIPVRCPKCSGRGRSYLASWRFKSFIPHPVFCYQCDLCEWTTHRWGKNPAKV